MRNFNRAVRELNITVVQVNILDSVTRSARLVVLQDIS
jgi:hypothetical protein